MAIKLDAAQIANVYAGATPVSKVALGSALVWSAAPPPAPVTTLVDVSDDGYHYYPFQPADYLDAVSVALWPGQAARVFCRFQLPADFDAAKPIVASRLRFTSRNADGAAQTRLHGYRAKNALAPANLEGSAALTQVANLTSASVLWDMPATAADEAFWSPDLAGVLNELLALGNAAGDNIVIWAVNTASGWIEKDVRASEAGPNGRPALEITYWEGG